MKTIPLTQGKVAIVDDEDYDWLNQWKWYALKVRNTFYAARHLKKEEGPAAFILMHFEIIGKREGFVTDHFNGNGLDNQRHNLRHVTNRQNHQNLHIEKSSKYPGVSCHKGSGKWRAQIRVGEGRKHLGLFTNEIDAYQAYKKAVEGTK